MRRSPRVSLGLSLGLLAFHGAACDPYEDFAKDGASLGPVDPVTFPPANLGTRGDRMRPGNGTFSELQAYADGQQIGYFTYAFSSASAKGDQLRLVDDGKPYAPVPATPAYVFDAEEGRAIPER